jgi:hypothetical protein
MIREVVASEPEFFRQLPSDFIVDGAWRDQVTGRKTEVKDYDFSSPDFPAHFNRTRCVFAAPDHRCLLQVLATERGLHPWTYKPRCCWLFPLSEKDGNLTPPPRQNEPDPQDMGPDYPGFRKFTACGQEHVEGIPWRIALSEEIAHQRITPVEVG